MIYSLHEVAIETLAKLDWNGFVGSYLEPQRSIITEYYRNFVEPTQWTWDDCIAAYYTHWFKNEQSRIELFQRLGGVDFSHVVRTYAKALETVLPWSSNIDVFIILGVGTSNAFQFMRDGKPMVGVAIEAWGDKFYGVDMPIEDLPMWIAHEMGHALRYQNPENPLAIEFHSNGFHLEQATRRLPLYEFLVDDGLAVFASKIAMPNKEVHQVLGYTAEQYSWCVQHERKVYDHLREIWQECPGPELYWEYFGGSTKGLPDRIGYYFGMRMVDSMIAKERDLPIQDLFLLPAKDFVDSYERLLNQA